MVLILLISLLLLYFLWNSNIAIFYSVFISMASGGFWFIITGLFENRKNYNKNLYLIITLAIIFVVLILIYNQASSLTSEGRIYSYVIGAIFTLTTILRCYSFNKWMKSQEALNKLLDLNSEDSVALNNNGARLVEIGQYQEALKCFDKIIEIDPKDAAAWHNKGVILEKLRKHREALDFYDKALYLDPKFALAKKDGKIILES
jgi:tetratricopeptide (TPR) repeat protein